MTETIALSLRFPYNQNREIKHVIAIILIKEITIDALFSLKVDNTKCSSELHCFITNPLCYGIDVFLR